MSADYLEETPSQLLALNEFAFFGTKLTYALQVAISSFRGRLQPGVIVCYSS
jgi:hypothetical protein